MSKSIAPAKAAIELPAVDIDRCTKLTGELFPGLDLAREISAVREQGIGETLVAEEPGELVGFAICHIGKGSEAGSGSAYIKFAAAVRGESFERLLAACEELAATRGATQLIAGVNSARRLAYSALIAHGYRGAMQGVLMQRPDAPCYNRPEVYVIDDCR
jgi:GNAT superfamily N-acetyltransferase